MRSAGKRESGVTLLEVMVASVLGALLLYALICLLLPAMRMSARGVALVDIDQRAALLEQRLERALKATSYRGVRSFAQGESRYLSTHPIEGAAANSKPKMASFLTVFTWSQGCLTESEVPLTEPPLCATVLPDGELLAALPSRRDYRVIEGVRHFEASLELGPVVRLAFRLGKDDQTLEVRRTIFLVNN